MRQAVRGLRPPTGRDLAKPPDLNGHGRHGIRTLGPPVQPFAGNFHAGTRARLRGL